VEVQLECVPIAGRYALDMKPIELENKSDFTMSIHIEALVPRPDEIRGGFDPIPDPAWVQFEPREFTVSANGHARSRVVLYIPEDEKLTGRKFEVSIFIRGVPVESPSVGVGLKPRLYFTVAGRDRPGMVVKLDAAPKFPRITPFELGSREGTMHFSPGTFTAQNQSGETMLYEIRPDASALGKTGAGGGELLPDLSWVNVRPSSLVLAPWGSAQVAVEVDLPIDSRHFGKAYVVPLHSVATRKSAPPVDVYNRVVVVVPDPMKKETGTGK
jgi:hypothetical protein